MTTTRVPLLIVDAFTDRAFAGNAAAVVLLTSSLDDDTMQRIAREMNQSETAFVMRMKTTTSPPQLDTGADAKRAFDDEEAAKGASSSFSLRWVTPTTEVNLCGHATLATTHALRTSGWLNESTRADFVTRSGVLHARVDDDGGIVLDFPLDPPRACAISIDDVARALRTDVREVLTGRDDLVVVVEDASVVRALHPSLSEVAALATRGVCVTAKSDDDRFDFVSRFFAPQSGIDEDPVTGSAHCMLVAYWAPRLHKERLRGAQLSARGGVVDVEMKDDRAILRGRCVTTVEGSLSVPMRTMATGG